MGPIRRLVTPMFLLTLVFLFTASITAAAMQTAAGQAPAEDGAAAGRAGSSRAATLPRTMRFSGIVHGADGAARSGVVALTFTMYSEAHGGAPVWVETQNVTLDENGRYTAMLGAGEGLPVALFAHGEARWLGVRVAEEGAAEHARVQLVSVPYALAAADAQSLGGRPATDFQLTQAAAIASGDGSAPGVVVSPTVNTTSNTVNRVARFTGVDTVGDSQIFDNGSNIGIGTTTPSALFHVNAVAGDAFNLYTSTTVGGSVAVYANHFGAAPIGYAGYFTKSGAGTTNIGLYAEATGGTNNYAALFQGGNVGIGTNAPVAKLQVNATNQDAIDIYSTATGGGSAALFASHSGATPLGYAGYFSKTGAGTTNIGLVGSASGAANNYAALFPSGNVGIGTSGPTQKLEVAGTIYSSTGGFRFPDNTVQTTAATGGGGGDITGVIAGNGLAGGATSGDATLNIKTCTEGQVLKYVGTTWTCAADATSGGGGGTTLFDGSSGANTAIVTVNQHGTGILNPDINTNTPPVAIFGLSDSNTGYTTGVAGKSTSPQGIGVIGIVTGGPTGQDENATALLGFATATTGRTRGIETSVASANGVAAKFRSTNTGGTALQANVGPDSGPDVARLEVNGSGISMIGSSFSMQGPSAPNANIQLGGPTQVTGALTVTGALSSSSISTSNITTPNMTGGGGGNSVALAGSMSITGNLNVTGNLQKGSGTFKIDHPLDPTNKYLFHSFVESPDMMNIYNGLVVLDAKGQAWVTMPDWFEALNMDFRYQLTPIGNPGRRIIYVASEIKGNRFGIAGGRPGSRISWEVTGVRHDAYANAHRIKVEENKPDGEKGTYLHPEAFKKPVLAQK